MNDSTTTRIIRRVVQGALLVGTLGVLAVPALASEQTSSSPSTLRAPTRTSVPTNTRMSAIEPAIPAKAPASTTTTKAPKNTNTNTNTNKNTNAGRRTLGQKPPAKNVPPVKPSYTGPKVIAGLPFALSRPSGSAREVAQAFARDASDLLNCGYGSFDKCAKAVWGRRDPWKLRQPGNRAAYDAPWVALWEKYAASGVVVWQSNGPYTEAYPQGVPMLDYAYRLTIEGQTFYLLMRDDPGHSFSNPSSWYVPGCAVCHAYEVSS